MTKGGNFHDQITPSIIDDEYVECNFHHKVYTLPEVDGKKVGVRIFPGDDTPRTFRRCNLTNCRMPPGSTIDDCNTTLSEFHQSHDVEQIIIDGETVATLETFKHIVYGTFNPDTDAYDYFPVPQEYVED